MYIGPKSFGIYTGPESNLVYTCPKSLRIHTSLESNLVYTGPKTRESTQVSKAWRDSLRSGCPRRPYRGYIRTTDRCVMLHRSEAKEGDYNFELSFKC